MSRPPTLRSGPWDIREVENFLRGIRIPVRVATSGRTGPLVQSLWFDYDDDAMWCCTQADALLVRRLRADARCGVEVAGDHPPYRGVRGRGTASIVPEAAPDVLPRLLDRYGIDRHAGLGHWLLSRLDTEVAIRIDDLVLSSWDYSSRMGQPASQASANARASSR